MLSNAFTASSYLRPSLAKWSRPARDRIASALALASMLKSGGPKHKRRARIAAPGADNRGVKETKRGFVRRCGLFAQHQQVFGNSHPTYHTLLVTLLGIVTLLRRKQKEKAWSPMLVTLAGIVTLVRLEQS